MGPFSRDLQGLTEQEEMLRELVEGKLSEGLSQSYFLPHSPLFSSSSFLTLPPEVAWFIWGRGSSPIK